MFWASSVWQLAQHSRADGLGEQGLPRAAGPAHQDMRKGQFPARLVAFIEIGVQGRAKHGYRPGLSHDAVQAGNQRFGFFIHGSLS